MDGKGGGKARKEIGEDGKAEAQARGKAINLLLLCSILSGARLSLAHSLSQQWPLICVLCPRRTSSS